MTKEIRYRMKDESYCAEPIKAHWKERGIKMLAAGDIFYYRKDREAIKQIEIWEDDKMIFVRSVRNRVPIGSWRTPK